MTTFRMAAMTAIVLTAAAVPAVAQKTGGGTAVQQAPATATKGSQVSDAMVNRVGKAIRNISTIRQQYTQRAEASNSPQARQELNSEAQRDMAKAVSDQGLTLQQYDQVIQMAQADQTLRQRLLSVAQSNN
ncbi:MAG TPA: DUF4168 domain-containing protein [Acetobacteraceae bacterium]|jgi:hypothetical protein|nr:DUF4168 domain-containing protein [Acetobacteraceae bacterium]